MKNKLTLLLSFSLLLSFACQSSKKIPFKKKDVIRAQKLMGLDLQKEQVDTMYQYLGRNLNGYDSLRNYTVGNEVFPALLFDPHPLGYEMPTAESQHHEWPSLKDIQLPLNKETIAFYNIRQLAALIQSRQISSEELTQLYLARLKKHDPQLKCVISFTEELALQQARKADQEIANGNYKGLLHGIPYGVKDLLAVEGYKTTWGAMPYKNQTINYTATVVKKLEAAGAVLIAKLTSGALARGDVWFGGKTKNPWDLEQGASGSSAGSGSATSAGLVAFSIGTETLGSITSPSNRNGVTGLRPSYGRVSRSGVMSLSWSMDKVGPICRSAEDCAIVLKAIMGTDKKDPTLVEAPFNFNPSEDVKQLKVAYLKRLFEKDSTDSKANRLQAVETLKKMGIQMTAIELPKQFPFAAFDVILRAESGAFFDELVRSGQVDQMVQQNGRSRANSLRQARFIPAVEYIPANRHRRVLIEEMYELIKDYDVIVAPTFGGRQLQITNLTGHPALAIPTGLDEKGHPTSITLIGNLYDEGAILALGMAFQRATSFDESHPPLFKVD